LTGRAQIQDHQRALAEADRLDPISSGRVFGKFDQGCAQGKAGE
jgi:hypothetical protein